MHSKVRQYIAGLAWPFPSQPDALGRPYILTRPGGVAIYLKDGDYIITEPDGSRYTAREGFHA